MDIDSHINPVIRLFSPRTTPSTLAVNLKFHGPNGDLADPLTKAVLKFSYGAKLNGKYFPSCSAATINNHGKCPKGSKIGGGSALAEVGGGFQEAVTVALFNGAKGNSIVFQIANVDPNAPVPLNDAFDAPLATNSGGTYNYTLTVNVPELLQRPNNVDISLDFFNVKVGATTTFKKKKVGYIETLICPPGALVPLQADFSFLEADPYHTDTYIHCG